MSRARKPGVNSPRRFLLIVIFAAIASWWLGPNESLRARAYRLCGDCGIASTVVDTFIETKRDSPLSRQQELDAFRSLFAGRDASLCELCANAVLSAAAKN